MNDLLCNETPVDQVPPGVVVQDTLPDGRTLYFVGGTRVDAARFRDARGLQPWEVWDTWLAQLCWGRQITIGRLFRINRAGAH